MRKKCKMQNEKRKTVEFCLFLRVVFLSFTLCALSFSLSFADTIYFTDGTTEKGLVVEEYYDRFVFSTPDGEKEVLNSAVDEIFFDEPHRNSLYLGRRSQTQGDFDKALLFYQRALQSNPSSTEAQDAVKGLEDAKWRYKKSWTYRELRDALKTQLGISLRAADGRIVIAKINFTEREQFSKGEPPPLVVGDVIIRSWAQPLTHAGLKNASRFLTGLSNTILNIVIERRVCVPPLPKFKLLPPLTIDMEYDGPVVSPSGPDNPFYKAGVREGDLLVAINGESTRYMKVTELRRKLFKAKSKELTIRREVTLMRRRAEKKMTTTAMWVWNTKEILLSDFGKKKFLDFCKTKNIGLAFFQLQYQFTGGQDRGQFSKRELSPQGDTVVCKLLYETRLKAFLREAHNQGLLVYALDGSPDFCLEESHKLVLAQVKAILDFNRDAGQQERFDGVHYDNEPYLLPSFNSSAKEAIIEQFVLLNRKCRNLIKSSGAKLDFGIDIPFWFDELEGLKDEQSQTLDKELIEICDNVGIMDYRNFASGPDGIVAHALPALKAASEANKKVYVGTETSRYPIQKAYFVSAVSEKEFNARPMNDIRVDGFTARAHPSGKKIYLGLLKPENVDEAKFKSALLKLAGRFGGISRPYSAEDSEKLIMDTIFALSSNAEIVDPRPEEYVDEKGQARLMFVAKEEMLEKLTFADKTEAELNSVLAEAKKEFEAYPAFAGFAIHYYKSYKELCDKR